MRTTTHKPAAISVAARNLLQQDLLTPASPLTPLTSLMEGINSPMDAMPTGQAAFSTGNGVIVQMSDGSLAVRAASKTLRIVTVGEPGEIIEEEPFAVGDAVTYRTDGSRAYEIARIK